MHPQHHRQGIGPPAPLPTEVVGANPPLQALPGHQGFQLLQEFFPSDLALLHLIVQIGKGRLIGHVLLPERRLRYLQYATIPLLFRDSLAFPSNQGQGFVFALRPLASAFSIQSMYPKQVYGNFRACPGIEKGIISNLSQFPSGPRWQGSRVAPLHRLHSGYTGPSAGVHRAGAF